MFQPELNEDLGATELWRAQMHKAYGATKADGVFGFWYGQGNPRLASIEAAAGRGNVVAFPARKAA